MSDLTPQQITVKEYKEIYKDFDKERLIQILIEDKLYIRKLHEQLYAKTKANGDNTRDSGLHLQRVMHRKSFLEERIAYTENKLKQNRNSEEIDSLEYDLYGFKQQLAAIEYVLYGA